VKLAEDTEPVTHFNFEVYFFPFILFTVFSSSPTQLEGKKVFFFLRWKEAWKWRQGNENPERSFISSFLVHSPLFLTFLNFFFLKPLNFFMLCLSSFNFFFLFRFNVFSSVPLSFVCRGRRVPRAWMLPWTQCVNLDLGQDWLEKRLKSFSMLVFSSLKI